MVHESMQRFDVDGKFKVNELIKRIHWEYREPKNFSVVLLLLSHCLVLLPLFVEVCVWSLF